MIIPSRAVHTSPHRPHRPPPIYDIQHLIITQLLGKFVYFCRLTFCLLLLGFLSLSLQKYLRGSAKEMPVLTNNMLLVFLEA